MVKKEVLSSLLDSKKFSILRVLLNCNEEMYLKEISQKSKVSLTSTFRILQEFTEMGLLRRREWKTSKVYSCAKNTKTEFLKELFYEEYDGVTDFVENIGQVKGMESIILHGSMKKGKANILLIGQDIDVAPVEEVCGRIRERGFDLSYLTLTKEQYEQMSKMGLYSGDKKVLK